MTGFWLLFRREIERRWTLLLACVLIGLIVAVLPWFEVWRAAKPGDIRGVGAFVAALLWALALAIGLGVADWPGDLRARRLSFDFRLPVRGGTIWSARAAAGLALTLGGSGIILLIPSLFGIELRAAVESLNWMATGIQGLPYWSAGQFVALLVAGLVLLYLLVQALALSLAGNRVMSVVAVAALLIAAVASWLAWGRLGSWFAVAGQRRWAVIAMILAITGLAVSLAWQAIRGRTESDRAGRALMPALVIASLAIIGCAQGYASWFLQPDLADLRASRWGHGAKADEPMERTLGPGWTLVEGAASGRPGLIFSFAKSSQDQEAVSLGPILGPWFSTPRAALSADGSRLAWPVIRRLTRRIDTALYILDTKDQHASPRRSLVSLPGMDCSWALSPDGRQVASIDYSGSRERLLYDDVDTGKRLASYPLAGLTIQKIEFTAPEKLSAVGWPSDAVEGRRNKRTYTIDLKDGSIHALGPTTSAQ